MKEIYKPLPYPKSNTPYGFSPKNQYKNGVGIDIVIKGVFVEIRGISA